MIAFLPFFLAPGYLAGYGLNLFHFRDAGWTERMLLSVTLSTAISPIAATLIGRYLSLRVACVFFAAITVAALVVAIRDARRQRGGRFSREMKIGGAIFAGWMVIAIASLVDLQFGTRLYMPMAAFDQCLRAALAAAALRTGVPPANPFFYPGHFVPMRYYYYWNVLCALPARMFGLTPRVSALAGVVWSGFALAALIPLYLKHFCEETVALGRKSLLGIALLAVTGLDLIPTIVYFLAQRTILADMEWWDGVQVTSWLDSLLWVPHHVAGLVACFIGFLVLWVVPRNSSQRERMQAAVIAGLAFASAAGLSVYVTFTFAIFLVIWTLVLLRSHLYPEVLMFAVTGIVTIVVSLGYLHDLRQPGYGGTFATFYVRALETVENFGDNHIPWQWLEDIFLALMLPVHYVVELGFFALVGFAQVRKYWRRQGPLLKWEWAAICICGVSLLVGSFLMSTTGNNDLGYRSILLAQFILLLWAVPTVYRWRAKGRRGSWRLACQVFLWVGVAGVLYQLIELRAFTILLDRSSYVDEAPWLPHSDDIGSDVYRARAGFEMLNRKLPQDAVIQVNPTNPAYDVNIYYARQQSVAGLRNCGTPFGGDPFACEPIQRKILEAFNGRNAYRTEDANQLCTDLGIDVLIAERSDRMWAIKRSWVWSGETLVENPYMRAVACGKRRAEVAAGFRR